MTNSTTSTAPVALLQKILGNERMTTLAMSLSSVFCGDACTNKNVLLMSKYSEMGRVDTVSDSACVVHVAESEFSLRPFSISKEQTGLMCHSDAPIDPEVAVASAIDGSGPVPTGFSLVDFGYKSLPRSFHKERYTTSLGFGKVN